MSGKMKRTMVLLLIMLKEAGQTAACSSSCSSQCSCSRRGLTSVPQDLPTYITYLSLFSNAITALNQYDFSRYRNLTRLYLSSNQISVINSGAFHNLTSLTELYLRSNQLTDIRADMFVGLDNLQALYLHYNTISTIEAVALVNLPALHILQLSHNNINTFPIEAYDILANISAVDISNNPWQCDCRMLPFARKMTGVPEFEEQIICAGPFTFQRKSLLQVVEDPIWDLILGLICEETATLPGSTAYASSPGSTTDVTVTSPGCSADGTTPDGFSLPLFLSSLGGVLLGAFLTSAVYSAAWCKIRRRKTAPNPVKYPTYRYASPRTAPSPELSLSVIDLNAEDTSVV